MLTALITKLGFIFEELACYISYLPDLVFIKIELRGLDKVEMTSNWLLYNRWHTLLNNSEP